MIGIGCVPSEEPRTDAERLVYASIKLIYGRAMHTDVAAPPEDTLLPVKPIFIDMAYKVGIHSDSTHARLTDRSSQ